MYFVYNYNLGKICYIFFNRLIIQSIIKQFRVTTTSIATTTTTTTDYSTAADNWRGEGQGGDHNRGS